MGERPGDLHLGDAEFLADLRSGHIAVKARQQDLPLPRGQLNPVRGEGLAVEHVLKPRVLPAEHFSQTLPIWPASRRVQGR